MVISLERFVVPSQAALTVSLPEAGTSNITNNSNNNITNSDGNSATNSVSNSVSNSATNSAGNSLGNSANGAAALTAEMLDFENPSPVPSPQARDSGLLAQTTPSNRYACRHAQA